MPWSFPLSMLSTRVTFQRLFDVVDGKQTDLNLFEFFGSPGQPADVLVTFDVIEVCSLVIGDWNPGSIITIIMTNESKVFGRGGGGGNGGESTLEGLISQCLGFSGTDGVPGQRAIRMTQGYTLDIDLDDAFVWGGGGGGGGGGATFNWPSDCDSGSGGGGGQGWATTTGGVGFLCPSGANGDSTGPGDGGAGSADCKFGGDGATWGRQGTNGETPANGVGGVGGRAIQTVNGATVNLVGAKNLATLEAEGMLLGRNGDPIGL